MITSDHGNLQQLETAISGDVVTPGDRHWDTVREVFNLVLDQRPAGIVFAETAADVVEAIGFARRSGLRVAPQSTGHNAGPLESLDDTLLLKTVRMRHVEINAQARRARVEAGARWEDVTARVSDLGLAALHGSSPDVGIAGYSLGGGMGWLARKHGLQTNSVTAIEIVTPDGRQRRVDADNEPELFWALRGGGGNFGVVTALEFALYPVEELYAGAMFFPAERVTEVLHAWHDLTPDLPDEMTSVGRLLHFPPQEEIPEPLRGGSFAIVEAAYLGGERGGATLLAPLRELGPVIDTFAMVPPLGLAELHMDPRDPVPYLTADRLLGDLPRSAIDDLIAAAGPGSGSTLVGFELRQMGGALARSEPGHGARATLDGSFSLFGLGVVAEPASKAVLERDLDRLTSAAAPWAIGRYANFAEQPTAASDFYAEETYRRLQAVKTLYDPDDLIRANHPIPPIAKQGNGDVVYRSDTRRPPPARILELGDLMQSSAASLFKGVEHGSSVSFFVTHHPPGTGPGLHRHPYDETFLIQHGTATFTVDHEKIEVRAGEIVVVPAGTAHGFVNSGEDVLRQVAIHACDHIVQEPVTS